MNTEELFTYDVQVVDDTETISKPITHTELLSIIGDAKDTALKVFTDNPRKRVYRYIGHDLYGERFRITFKRNNK